MALARLHYLTQRLVRNWLPGPVAAWARRRLGGIPGGESDAPEEFADHYAETLAREGESFAGRAVLLFGHGPSYGMGCALLQRGVTHVYLFDPYADPDDLLNRRWLAEYPGCLEETSAGIRPRPAGMTEIGAGETPHEAQLPVVDLVLSTSVFEHLDDVGLWVDKLAGITAPGGCQVHMIDLRDHFFDRPFEMLCYSEAAWTRWLNPRHNLNRWRLDQYEEAFRRHWSEVRIETIGREEELFAAARPRIRPEFLTGDPKIDSITEIEVFVRGARPPTGEEAR
ncbi:MAG: hypothetical protein R3325_16860 [Thermoanaerobaculia bacterium]|nr:hypothetical protein [Thermoanaerobaculia bacterium]